MQHSDMLCLGLHASIISLTYRSILQNTTHLQQKQYTSGQLNVSCQGWVHPLKPLEKGESHLDLLGFAPLSGKTSFINLFFFLLFFPSFYPPCIPSQHFNQNMWLSRPALKVMLWVNLWPKKAMLTSWQRLHEAWAEGPAFQNGIYIHHWKKGKGNL